MLCYLMSLLYSVPTEIFELPKISFDKKNPVILGKDSENKIELAAKHSKIV